MKSPNLRQNIWLTLYFAGLNLSFNDNANPFKSALATWLEFHAVQKYAFKDIADEV